MSPSIRFLMTTGLGKKRALSCSVTYQFHIHKCNYYYYSTNYYHYYHYHYYYYTRLTALFPGIPG